MLAALASVTFIIEGLFPPLIVPGAKMGLSNIFSLLAVVLFSPVDGVILVAVRTTIGALVTGSMSAWLYSFSAGVVSVAVSGFLYRLAGDRLSLLSISVAAAVAHNVTQNTVFCLITSTPEMYAYLPYLAVVGVPAGLIVGVAAALILKSVPFDRFLKDDRLR